MAAIQTILCPVDFSECALNAVEFASRIGERYQARLILVHIANKEDYFKLFPRSKGNELQLSFLTEKLQNLLEAVQKESLQKGLQGCEMLIRDGEIVGDLLQIAQEQKADLIVMGTEGMNDQRPRQVGSRTSHLVEKSEVDVLVIPRNTYYRPFQKLVFGTDFVEEDKLAVQKVSELARFFDAPVCILHISKKDSLYQQALWETMKEELRPFIRYERIQFETWISDHDPAQALSDYLESAGGDMLITWSRKRDFFQKIFTKSLSKKLSYFLEKPLWIMKSN